jgi:hypothetical protein
MTVPCGKKSSFSEGAGYARDWRKAAPGRVLIDTINVVFPPDNLSSTDVKPNENVQFCL